MDVGALSMDGARLRRLASLVEAGACVLANRLEPITAARQDLVRIRLVAHVPHDAVIPGATKIESSKPCGQGNGSSTIRREG